MRANSEARTKIKVEIAQKIQVITGISLISTRAISLIKYTPQTKNVELKIIRPKNNNALVSKFN